MVAFEGATSGADRCVHVGGRRVGGDAEHLLGGGVQRLERPAAGGRGECAVDQQDVESVWQLGRCGA